MPSLRRQLKDLAQFRIEYEAGLNHQDSIARDPRHNRILEQFPDEGPFRRELYPKHMEFFAAGKDEMERCFMAGNRVGKTRAGACELTYHLTGRYPHWWVGKRFDKPISAWAGGSTAQTVRDIVQAELLGRVAPDKHSRTEDRMGLGTGMIPLHRIIKVQPRKGGVSDAIDQAYIQHISGGTSVLGFKSYSQRRKSFEGTAQDCIWVDEECPYDVYLDCLTRLLTTRGIIWSTFTPLQGLTEVVLRFLPAGRL
jgi:phage terminase large subunit-like protein